MRYGNPTRAARSRVIRLLLAVGVLATISPRSLAKIGPSYWFRILVPDNLVPAQIGRAVFREGNDEVIVLAANLPVRSFALREITGLASASVSHLPGATVLRIPMPAGQTLVTKAGRASLHVRIGVEPGPQPISASFEKGEIRFATALAGPVVTLSGSKTGWPVLVGTVTGSAALAEHLVGPGYRSVSASAGVAVLAVSDELALSSGAEGFILRALRPVGGLPVGYPPLSLPAVGTPFRPGGLNLPRYGLAELRSRLHADRLRVAEVAPLARRGAALRLARVMLALDMAPEARGVLHDLVRTNPSVKHDTGWRRLLVAADVLAGEPQAVAQDCGGRCADTPDASLWRGLSDAEAGNVADATKELTHATRALAALPSMVRAQVAPLAVETLITGGDTNAAKRLLSWLPAEHDLDLARAELKEATGARKAALAAYRALFNARDNRTAGIARTRAIVLRYHLHQIDVKEAAAALSRHVYDWRSPRHELSVRLEIARLQAVYGAWPQALTGLDRTRTLFPRQRVAIDAVRHRIFHKLIASGGLDRMTPLAVTALIQNNTDLVPRGRAGVPVLNILSQRLLALGLTEPAAGILHHLIHRSQDPESRASLGLDLARLELRAGSLKAAQAALDTTQSAGLAPALASARNVVASQIATEEGKPTTADFVMAAKDPQALTAMARHAAEQGDWVRAEQAWKRVAALEVPATGPLDRQQAQVVTAWATSAANAKDRNTVKRLRTAYLSRMSAGSQAALFGTITARPLSANASLAQALTQIRAIEALADGNKSAPDSVAK